MGHKCRKSKVRRLWAGNVSVWELESPVAMFEGHREHWETESWVQMGAYKM